MLKKKITVLMPFYNAEKTLELSICSILNQSYKYFDLYLVNDGSHDNSYEVAVKKAKEDPRIILTQNIKNIGLAKSLNNIIFNLKTDYIARMDADDESHKNRFETQINILENNKSISIIGTNADYFNNNVFLGSSNLPLDNNSIKNKLSKLNVIIHPTTMMRTNFLKDIGGYNNFFTYSQDYDLWLRARKKYNFINLDDKLLKHKIVPKKKMKNDVFGIYARIVNLSLNKHFFVQFIWIFVTLISIFLRQIGFRPSIFRKIK
jgi:glycosyltransferase EpsE